MASPEVDESGAMLMRSLPASQGCSRPDVDRPHDRHVGGQPVPVDGTAGVETTRPRPQWLDSLRYVLNSRGEERRPISSRIEQEAYRLGVPIPFSATTPYINTIPVDKQPLFPGNREPQRRIQADPLERDGDGGEGQSRGQEHRRDISTFASSATLVEVAMNDFIRVCGDDSSGDQVYFQGHASPGFTPAPSGRDGSRRSNWRISVSADGGGLSSYPHPWLMPGFWEFPTASMGLGP